MSAAKVAGLVLVAAACGVDTRTFQDPDEGGASAAGNDGAPSGADVSAGGAGGTAPATPGGAAPVPSGGSGGDSSTASAAPGTSVGGSAAGGSASGGSAGGASESGGATGAAPPDAAVAAPCGLRLAAPTIVSFDDVFTTVASDLAGLDAGDQLSARYLILTNRQSAGAPACELDADSRLLLELLSSLVVDPSRPGPALLGGTPRIYRIDLRAYAWDITVALGESDFSDTWEAIVASSPYAVSFVGDAADDALIDSGTQIPVLFASALVEQMLAGVPPLPLGVLATLQQDPELSAALARVSAPVVSRDASGDLGISLRELNDALPSLPPGLQSLGGTVGLERAAYAPLFLPSLCIVSVTLMNQPDPSSCPP